MQRTVGSTPPGVEPTVLYALQLPSGLFKENSLAKNRNTLEKLQREREKKRKADEKRARKRDKKEEVKAPVEAT